MEGYMHGWMNGCQDEWMDEWVCESAKCMSTDNSEINHFTTNYYIL